MVYGQRLDGKERRSGLMVRAAMAMELFFIGGCYGL